MIDKESILNYLDTNIYALISLKDSGGRFEDIIFDERIKIYRSIVERINKGEFDVKGEKNAN